MPNSELDNAADLLFSQLSEISGLPKRKRKLTKGKSPTAKKPKKTPASNKKNSKSIQSAKPKLAPKKKTKKPVQAQRKSREKKDKQKPKSAVQINASLGKQSFSEAYDAELESQLLALETPTASENEHQQEVGRDQNFQPDAAKDYDHEDAFVGQDDDDDNADDTETALEAQLQQLFEVQNAIMGLQKAGRRVRKKKKPVAAAAATDE